MQQVETLLNACRQRGWKIAVAESCTGGMIAAAITDIPGASEVFDRGFITYSNAAKTQMLGVPAAMITQHGAVSEAVAKAMAQGALQHSQADVSVSVTGVAGPGGGSDAKPVGTVWIGWAVKGQVAQAQHFHFSGNRAQTREAAMQAALHQLLQFCG